MKLPLDVADGQRAHVAPHAGAWIETGITFCRVMVPLESHPTRVRGLKQGLLRKLQKVFDVAPHAGAWIETRSSRRAKSSRRSVAPHAGA